MTFIFHNSSQGASREKHFFQVYQIFIHVLPMFMFILICYNLSITVIVVCTNILTVYQSWASVPKMLSRLAAGEWVCRAGDFS